MTLQLASTKIQPANRGRTQKSENSTDNQARPQADHSDY